MRIKVKEGRKQIVEVRDGLGVKVKETKGECECEKNSEDKGEIDRKG